MRPGNASIVAAISVSVLALELAWTRLFSAEFFYTFAFLILSLAVLGLGLGALSLRFVPFFRRRSSLGLVLTLAGLCALAGPPVLFLLELDLTRLFDAWSQVGKFIVALVILQSAYFFCGAALALLFRLEHEKLPQLYAADLLGAAAGTLLIILLMNAVGTPAATFACALPVLLAGAFVSPWRWKPVPLALLVAMVFMGTTQAHRLERTREERAPVIYKHWDAMAKIKILEFEPEHRGIQIDNAANSPVYGFDGNWDRPDSLRFEFGIDVRYLIAQFDSCRFLSLGAGGGVDVLQALQAGATVVHAVEVVPHINELMTTGPLAEFSGRIYADPRVRVVTEDARAYVRRHPNSFDVIYSLSSNTFSALASGAFAMAESYLFTTEAFRDYWLALGERGFMMMEHQFYVPRLVTEALEALTALGVAEPQAHVAVYDLPKMRRNILFLSKQPLDDTQRRFAFGELTAEKEADIALLYPAPAGRPEPAMHRIVTRGWRAERDSSAIDLSPCDDNRPFTAQLGLWKNLAFGEPNVSPYEFKGFPLAKLFITLVLAVLVLLVLPLCVLPYLWSKETLRPVPWLYFFVLGTAFMCVEVVLIHRYTLLIGASLYSTVTVLVTLLVGSGLGSRCAPRFGARVVFGAIVVWLCLDVLFFNRIVALLGHWQLPARMALAAVLMAPLGFFMGMPFPKGGVRVGATIDWGFAVNGSAAVFGATLVLLLAFTHGFRVALLLAAALYLVASWLYSRDARWSRISRDAAAPGGGCGGGAGPAP